jgi:hypothetical protein
MNAEYAAGQALRLVDCQADFGRAAGVLYFVADNRSSPSEFPFAADSLAVFDAIFIEIVLLEFTRKVHGSMPLAAVLAEIRTDFLLFAFFGHEFAFG